MDRERRRDQQRTRFVARAEDLEGRALLAANPAASVTQATAQVISAQDQLKRIQNLPFFLRTLDRDRILPPEITSAIQTDLLALQGKLRPPGPGVVRAFNTQLRKTIPTQNLKASDAQGLNQTFAAVLQAANADPAVLADLQTRMNELAQVDASQRRSTYLATNDYSMVLQVALAVGRPAKAAVQTTGTAHPQGPLAVQRLANT